MDTVENGPPGIVCFVLVRRGVVCGSGDDFAGMDNPVCKLCALSAVGSVPLRWDIRLEVDEIAAVLLSGEQMPVTVDLILSDMDGVDKVVFVGSEDPGLGPVVLGIYKRGDGGEGKAERALKLSEIGVGIFVPLVCVVADDVTTKA
jgi:hypothetical protein